MRKMAVVKKQSKYNSVENSPQIILNESYNLLGEITCGLLVSRLPKRPNVLDRIRVGNLIDENGKDVIFDNV